jgi:hypothetical protein
MKMHHAHYANQKLKTPWGDIQCDASGIADVQKDAQEFFKTTLKFKHVGKDTVIETEAPKAPIVEPSNVVHDELAAADTEELGEDLLEDHEEPSEEAAEEGNSRFAKKSHAPKHAAKKTGHKK